MEAELRSLLTGFDDNVIAALAHNDIRSVEDARLLSVDDLKELGFTLGVRNRLIKTIADAQPGMARKLAGSFKNMLVGAAPAGLLSLAETGGPPELAAFKRVFNLGGSDAATKARRDKLYSCWDLNANGFLSLAEVDQGIKVTLIGELKDKKEGERIWRHFRKSFIRAFVDAADAEPQRKKVRTTDSVGGGRRAVSDDDSVSRREFRLLLCYLSIYATMYELFAAVDGTSEGVTIEDDNRISRDEWDAGLDTMQRAAASWAPFVALRSASPASFDEIDTNHGGFVLLTELCEWLEKGEKQACTPTGLLLGHNEE